MLSLNVTLCLTSALNGVLGPLEIIEPGSAVLLDGSPPVLSLEIASLLMVTCSCQRPHPRAVQTVPLPSPLVVVLMVTLAKSKHVR